MKSMCQDARRNSPSVAERRPACCCRAMTSTMAASSARGQRGGIDPSRRREPRARPTTMAGAAGCRRDRRGTGRTSGRAWTYSTAPAPPRSSAVPPSGSRIRAPQTVGERRPRPGRRRAHGVLQPLAPVVEAAGPAGRHHGHGHRDRPDQRLLRGPRPGPGQAHRRGRAGEAFPELPAVGREVAAASPSSLRSRLRRGTRSVRMRRRPGGPVAGGALVRRAWDSGAEAAAPRRRDDVRGAAPRGVRREAGAPGRSSTARGAASASEKAAWSTPAPPRAAPGAASSRGPAGSGRLEPQPVVECGRLQAEAEDPARAPTGRDSRR